MVTTDPLATGLRKMRTSDSNNFNILHHEEIVAILKEYDTLTEEAVVGAEALTQLADMDARAETAEDALAAAQRSLGRATICANFYRQLAHDGVRLNKATDRAFLYALTGKDIGQQ